MPTSAIFEIQFVSLWQRQLRLISRAAVRKNCFLCFKFRGVYEIVNYWVPWIGRVQQIVVQNDKLPETTRSQQSDFREFFQYCMEKSRNLFVPLGNCTELQMDIEYVRRYIGERFFWKRKETNNFLQGDLVKTVLQITTLIRS